MIENYLLVFIWWGGSGVYNFPKGIRPNMNVIALLEFELTNYDVVDQYISHNAIMTLLVMK